MWHGWELGHGWGWGGWLIGGLMMLLFWGGLIAMAFFALRALMRSGQGRDQGATRSNIGETALEILQKRYAQGEINRKEYLETKQVLGM